MNFKIALNITLIFFSHLAFAQNINFYVKDFGAKGDGLQDDYPAIQKAFDSAKSTKNSTVFFEKTKIYSISKPIKVYSNIHGNNATLRPSSTQALIFQSPGLKINSLTIRGGKFKYLRIDQHHITLENCHLETDAYFALLAVTADRLNIKNSKIINKKKDERHFAISAISGISDLSIVGNLIEGGLYFKNKANNIAANYLIKNNKISVDYSKLPQTMREQNDAFTFYGISDVNFISNQITLKNVNRGFKISASAVFNESKTVLKKSDSDNFLFKDNHIAANAINGKQLFDFYIGTKSVRFENNLIESSGFITLFENKTTRDVGSRIFCLSSNDIHFDSEILYFNGEGKNTAKNNIISIHNNTFTYTRGEFNFRTKRIGQSDAIKFNYVFNIRNVDIFRYENNILIDRYNALAFRNRYFFYLKNILETNISHSNYKGAIRYDPVRSNSKIYTTGNGIMDSGFKSTIETDPKNKIKFDVKMD